LFGEIEVEKTEENSMNHLMNMLDNMNFENKQHQNELINIGADHDPLIQEQKKKGKTKTKRDNKIEAIKMISNGHVANPLGVVDNRPKPLNPKLARDVPAENISTVPQLYRFLLKKYKEIFGEDIIGQLLPDDKTAIAHRFSELAQKFRDCCGFEPKRSDLAFYFEWFLDAGRIQKMMLSKKYRGQNIFVSWEQLTGSVYIKRFYDEVLSKRNMSDVFETETTGAKVRKIYDTILSYEKNKQTLMIAFVNAGYILSGQFLYDEKNMTEEDSQNYILSLMTEFISTSSDRDKAIEFLRRIEDSTKSNMESCKNGCIWYDWEVKCKWMLDKSIEVSKIK